MKRILGVIMIMTLLLSTFTYAKEVEEQQNVSIVRIAQDMLQVVMNEPEVYGFSGVNVEDLTICKPMRPYKLTGEGLEIITDVEYYPLLEGKKVVGNFTVCYDEDGEYSVNFDTQFVKELNKFINKKNDKFILIHNDGELLIKNQNGMQKIATSNVRDSKEIDLRAIEAKPVEYEVLEVFGAVELSTRDISTYATSSTYKRLDMLYVPQGVDNNCWAGAAASMGEFYTGIVKTARYVCDALKIGYNEGGTVNDIRDALSSIYGKSAESGAFILSLSDVVTLIDNDIPIGAGFSNSSHGHAAIICGYSCGSQGFVGIVRDSNYSSYKLVYETSGNVFKMDYYSSYGTMKWVNSVVVN